MKRTQRTIRSEVEFSGVGLHRGKEVRVRIKPAPPDHGVVFTRVDLEDAPQIPANPDSILVKERRTSLKQGPAEVETVEHLLASFKGLMLDNLEVEVDGEEIPGMDGSCAPIVEVLEKAGIQEQKAMARFFPLKEPVYVREGNRSIVAFPSEEGLSLEYHLDIPGGPRQAVFWNYGQDGFVRELAPARTFCMEEEAEKLQEEGFGQGASYENTLVLRSDGTPVANDLRFQDEPARHKVLDLLGDLTLLGMDIGAHVIAHRSGHAQNVKLLRKIYEQVQEAEVSGEFKHETSIDIRDIMKLLPHRYPFLLIDRVVELDGFRRAVGIKNVTINEPFFQGHWPEQPIMPGVLQLEAMAQLAGVLLLRKLENTGKLAVLWSIDKVKLRGAVIPGDQLRIEVETVRLKSSLGHVKARAKVRGKLVAEAQLKFTLVEA